MSAQESGPSLRLCLDLRGKLTLTKPSPLPTCPGCHCQTLGQLSPGSSYLRVHQRRGQANRSSCTTLDFKEGNMEQEREFQKQRLAVSLERVSLVATGTEKE
ncbi:uncharacterized protein LOC122216577 isoform X2 [Panthera leo]|uniref:uncharacterized protein LOC122216577 isoform X2 n=1 Tax=Panthera leo TaxID=9689 RepID=UPI001C6A46F7|nr:uncharacterized protein LOC122216577 isoform X2 [Panthera leo]